MPNSARDVYGAKAKKAKPKKRAPQPPPVAIRDSGVQSDANRVRTPPASTTAFGPPRRADSGLTSAARARRRVTNRAARKVNRGVSIAAVPRLKNPTPRQRALAVSLVTRSARGLGAAGVTPAQLPRQQRQRIATAMEYRGAAQRQADMGAGYEALLDGRVRLSRQDLILLRAHPRRMLAKVGREYALSRRSEHKPLSPELRVQRASSGVGALIEAVTTLDRGDLGPREFFKNAVADVKGVATFPVVAGYELGAGLWEASGGETDRLEALGKGVLQGIDQSVPGQLILHGDPQGALESFRQHPVFAALDVAGAGAVAGRGAGAVARGLGKHGAPGIRGALAREGSTLRLPIGLNQDGGLAVAQRSYSKDLLRKGVQRGADRKRGWLLKDPSKPATRDNIVHVEDPRARRPVPVLKALPGEEKLLRARRTDFAASRANAVERYQREVTGRELAKVDRGGRVRGRIGKKGQAIVSMAVEGTLRERHFKADVTKRIKRLEAKLQDPAKNYRHTGEVKKAREELKALRRAEQLSPVQQARVFAAAKAIGRARRQQDAEMARLGVAPREQLDRAVLEPYAISHMDARHVTVEEHVALERQARQVESAARAAVDAAPKGTPARAAALSAWKAAREQRIRVSGRNPGGVRLHENAARQAARAKTAHGKVKREIEKLERRRRDVAAAQRVRRGHKDDKNVRRGQRQLADIDAKIKQLRVQEKAARKAAVDARRMADSTKLPDTEAALRRPDGTFLSNKDIEADMRAADVDPAAVGQLTHKDLGGGAHHKRFDVVRPTVSTQRRTGAAFDRGASGHGPEQVIDSGANAATTVAKAGQVDRFVNDNALIHPAMSKKARGQKLTKAEQKIVDRGGHFTAAEAVELADRLEADTGRGYVLVRTRGARLAPDQQRAVGQQQHPRAFEELSSRLLNDRIIDRKTVTGKEGARNVALVAVEDMNRLARHMARAGELERLVQMLNRPFRFSVLAQPRWLAGNFVEPFFVRLPMVGSGVINIPGMALDIRRSMKTLKSMERSGNPKVRAAAAEIRAQQLGGLFLGGRGASVRRRAIDSENKVIHAGGVIRNMPVVKQIGDLLQIPPTAYFKANRVLIEQWAQHAALGRSIRKDLEELNGSWMKSWSTGQAALKDARRGLMNTATQERFMRAQHELLGKYEGFSPQMRRLVQTVAPFLPWALSAARFTFWTMPVHHTIKTSLLMKTAQVVEQSWADEHENVPPGGLKLAVQTKGGGWVDLARYTPYGFSAPIAEGDPQGITDQFFPQVSGAVAALGGHDPFNRDLRVEPSKDNPQGIPSLGQKLGVAAYGLLESLGGPYWALARRLQEGGGTAYADSTVFDPAVKPGSSHMSALRRTLDPFRPTYLKKKSTPNAGIDPGELEKLKREAAQEAGSGISDEERRKLLREAALAGG